MKRILISLGLLVITINTLSFPTAKAIDSTSNKQLFINEISWMGSSLGFTDEWIEFYNDSTADINLSNFTLFGAGNSTLGINLSGVIKAKGYYLLSRNEETNPKSILNIKPDLVSSKVSITNSSFNIYLKNNSDQIVYDEVNTGGKAPFAGSNGPIYATMSRITNATNGNDPLSWKDSTKRTNIDSPGTNADISCGADFATPKAENFTNLTTDQVIELKNLCLSKGKLNNQDELEFFGPLDDEPTLNLNIDFEKQAQKYSIKLIGNTENTIDMNGTFGKLTLTLGEQKVDQNIYKFSSLPTEIFIAKPKDIEKGNLVLSLNLDTNEKLSLKKIEVNKLSNSSQDIQFEAKDLALTNTHAQLMLDSISNKNVMYVSKNSVGIFTDQAFVQNIDLEKSQIFEAKVNMKFENTTENLQPYDSILTINISNPFYPDQTSIKSIRASDITANYTDYSFYFVSEPTGNNYLSLYSSGKSDIYLDQIILTKVEKLPDKVDINILDALDPSVKDFHYQDQALIFNPTNSASNNILKFQTSLYCIGEISCQIQLQTKSTANTGKLYITYKDKNGNGRFHIKHIASKTPENDFSITTIDLPASIQNLEIGFQYNGLEPVMIRDIQIYRRQLGSKLVLENIFHNDTSLRQKLVSNLDNQAVRGKIASVWKTSFKAEPGSYKINLKIKKLEKFSTNKKILKIVSFDDFGNNLLEKEIDENDLSSFSENNINMILNLETSSNIYTFIKYYGNIYGAYSDLEISPPSISTN
jgi:hypothetical protein